MNFTDILLISLGVLAAVLIGLQIWRMQHYKGLHYSPFSFRREGLALGLEKREIHLLRDIALLCKVKYFNQLYSSQRLLDNTVIRTAGLVRKQKTTDQQKHDYLEEVFLLRNKIEFLFAARKQSITSTLQLRANQPLRLVFKGIGEYPSRVLDNSPRGLVAAMPIETMQTEAFSWRKRKVQAFFGIRNDAEYAVESRVIDQGADENTGMLVIEHTDRLVRTQKRIFQRSNVNLSVQIFLLKVIVSGGSRKISVSPAPPISAMILNLSADGMALRTTGILKENTLVKLDFSLDIGGNQSVIGRILGFSVIPNSADKVLHVKFVRMSKKTRNAIFEFIYHESLFGSTDKKTPSIIVSPFDPAAMTGTPPSPGKDPGTTGPEI